jgi:tripartite-type tricarboxylate transporter receptor subunit TctC
MKLFFCNSRRVLASGLALLCMAAAYATTATAQDYPNKAIKLVVPFPPGGGTDLIGRVMATRLSVALGQPVVVENRAGAAATIGAVAVAKAPADGYTLLMGAITVHATYLALQSQVQGQTPSFDIDKSFSPVAIVATIPSVIAVNAAVKANTLAELIALAKAKPGALTLASSGNGALTHLAGEVFQRMAGVKVLHVPYKGTAPAMIDLIGGQVDIIITDVAVTAPHINAGKLRGLAVLANQRMSIIGAVPTAAEAGLPGFDISATLGILAPAGTPAPVIAKLNDALKGIMGTTEMRDYLMAQGVFAAYTTPEEASQTIRRELAFWTKVVKDANIKPD